MLNTVDDVIDALGGNKVAKELAGVGITAVLNWRARRSIPAEYFLLFSKALADAGKGPAESSVFTFKGEEARV